MLQFTVNSCYICCSQIGRNICYPNLLQNYSKCNVGVKFPTPPATNQPIRGANRHGSIFIFIYVFKILILLSNLMYDFLVITNFLLIVFEKKKIRIESRYPRDLAIFVENLINKLPRRE